MEEPSSLTSQAQAWLDSRRDICRINQEALQSGTHYQWPPEALLPGLLGDPLLEALQVLLQALPPEHPDRALLPLLKGPPI